MINKLHYNNLINVLSKIAAAFDYYFMERMAEADNNGFIMRIGSTEDSINFKFSGYQFSLRFKIMARNNHVILETFELILDSNNYRSQKAVPIARLKAISHGGGYFKMLGNDVTTITNIEQDIHNIPLQYFKALKDMLSERELAEFDALDEETKRVFR